ncbi:MAG: protein kinase [Verrucomicrobia bacterium]|nr:protein kinase [Verrucomicrobiota bacterium]
MAEPVHFQHFEVPLRGDGSLYELGRGAMGITYKAFDTNLRCFVALKVINAAYLSSDVARQRFLREARAAAALRHPNVATVFHLGEEGGDCFYAMEFVDGETVEAMMKRDGAIPAPTALEIVLQVARALGAAHKQGLVHRDIKPSNLMIVREDDSEFTVKVIDFGLAKSSTGSEGEDAATLTVGGFLGTPHFASPEQLDERDLDVRSDIYSLGVTLFYMLAGRAPFSGSLAQVMSQHLHRDPPLETLSNQPAPVVELLRHMLAKDPAARPQTPADLRHEVEACLVALKANGAPATPPLPVAPDNFETQVLEEPVTCEPAELAKGSVLAGRYQLVEEVQASDFGPVFKAQSLETPGLVAILVLDPSLLASSEACTRIEDQVVALQKLQVPALQKILSLERLEDNTVFLVLEWIDGPSLLDLMRARKALPALEARPLLRELAAGFQALQAAGIPCPDIASRAVLLCSADLSRPVTEWPQAAVKFNPISPGTPAAPPDATLVISAFGALLESGAFRGNENRAYVYALGSLAYEMLGGVRGGSSSGGPVPIPGLPEAANNALRRALDPSVSFESPTAFLDGLESETPTSKAPASARHETSHVQAPHASSPPPLPAPEKSRVVILLLAAALFILGVLGGGGYLLLKLRTTATPPQSSPTPVPPATASPSPSPTPSPEPTPDPALAVLARARETAQVDPAAALAMLVELQKSHPDLADAKEALKEFLSATLDRRNSLTPGQIAALRGPLEGAAASDFVDAQVLLGGELRETDPESALKWTLAAANNGSTDAMLSAGLMLSNDIGAQKKNPQEAARWFQRAAEAGDPHAMFALGECYQLSKGVTRDPKLALEWINKAAERNEVNALNRLGDIYNKGIPGLVQPDLKKAFTYFSAAKDLGLSDAYGNLGALFMSAPPSMKDEKMAVEIFKQGIEKGDARSMYFYAVCLEEGLGGLAPDKAAARQSYVKAAELGVAGAQEWCRKNRVTFTPPVRPPR